MTNNYFKLLHYIPIMELRLDEKTLFFFFDEMDAGSVEQALRAARESTSTIGSLTYGRHVQLSVYRKLFEHPEVVEIGRFVPRVVRPAA